MFSDAGTARLPDERREAWEGFLRGLVWSPVGGRRRLFEDEGAPSSAVVP